MKTTNIKFLSQLKGVLVFSYFLLRGVSYGELLGQGAGTIDFSIGTYLLACGLVFFSILALLEKNTALPTQFFYLFGVIFLTTISFLFWSNLNAGSASLSLWLEYAMSLSMVLFIFFTFRSEQEIETFFKALIYSSVIISLFWAIKAIQNPNDIWRAGNVLGSGTNYSTVSYQLAGAVWAGPLVNFLDSSRSFKSKIIIDFPFLIIIAFGILLTGTKGGVMILIFLLTIFWYLHFKRIKKDSTLKFARNFFLLIILPVGTLGIYATTWSGGLGPINRVILGLIAPEGYGGRFEIWAYSLGLSFTDLTSLFVGRGFGSFNLTQAGSYPHNFFLDLAFNGGFPAAILFTFWLSRIFLLDFRQMKLKDQNPKSRKLMLKTVGWGIVSCFYALVSGKFSSHTTLWFFLGLSIRLHQITLSALRAKKDGQIN